MDSNPKKEIIMTGFSTQGLKELVKGKTAQELDGLFKAFPDLKRDLRHEEKRTNVTSLLKVRSENKRLGPLGFIDLIYEANGHRVVFSNGFAEIQGWPTQAWLRFVANTDTLKHYRFGVDGDGLRVYKIIRTKATDTKPFPVDLGYLHECLTDGMEVSAKDLHSICREACEAAMVEKTEEKDITSEVEIALEVPDRWHSGGFSVVLKHGGINIALTGYNSQYYPVVAEIPLIACESLMSNAGIELVPYKPEPHAGNPPTLYRLDKVEEVY